MAKTIIFRAKADAYALELALRKVNDLTRVLEVHAREKILAHDNVDTGALLISIRTDTRVTTHKIKARVGSNRPYAMVIHQGAKPHLIAPRRKTGLKFYWPAGVGGLTVGRMVCFKGIVHHPGIKSNKYLLLPLVIDAPRFGFRVEPYP